MKQFISPIAAILFGIALAASSLSAQTGADVIVGDLTGPSNYGSDDGGQTYAFAIGTTSCNVGTAELLWISNTNEHPVIGQNIYQVKDGVFRPAGISWLKHGFFALQQGLCGSCSPSGTGSRLGIGCSDPYSSSLNGSQGGLGPRYEVNAATGVFPYPNASPSYSGNDRRIRVDASLLDPSQNQGARYFGEGHYVAADDAAAGNDENNASWREMTVSGNPASGYSMSMSGPTVREEPAIMAWPTVSPSAQVTHIDVPGDGRIFVGMNVIPLPNGDNRYVYAVHNLNSDRSVGGIEIDMPAAHGATNQQFINVPWHSGELFQSTPWNGSTTATSVTWTTPTPYQTDQWGSAIRWGSTSTFIFESRAVPGDVHLDLFKPGTPTRVTLPAFVLPTPSWESNSPDALLSIDGGTNDPFLGPIEAEAVYGQTSTVDLGAAPGASYQIFVQAGSGIPGAPAMPGYPIVNLDLAQPLVEFFPTFPSMPAPGTLQLPLFAPNFDVDAAAQLLAVDAGAPLGYHLSACNEYEVRAGAVAIVAAEGGNSYNSNASVGMWTVEQTGNGLSPIVRVTFTSTTSRRFDLDQSGMSGTTWCGASGGTYRNGTDTLVGLIYDSQNLVGPCGNSGLIASSAFTDQVTWRFNDFNNGEVFEFDLDTDNGGSSQNGASQAGIVVEIELQNGSIISGALQADPNNNQRSFVELR